MQQHQRGATMISTSDPTTFNPTSGGVGPEDRDRNNVTSTASGSNSTPSTSSLLGSLAYPSSKLNLELEITPSRPSNGGRGAGVGAGAGAGASSFNRQRGESTPVTSRHAPPILSSTNNNHNHGSSLHNGYSSASTLYGRRGSTTAIEGLSTSEYEPFHDSKHSSHANRAGNTSSNPNEADHPSQNATSTRNLQVRSSSQATSVNGSTRDRETSSTHRTQSPTSSGAATASTRSSQHLNAPSSSSSTANSSKSVLTIALQRAQSAVLLDSANNVPAAISAYSSSVRLLKEVMARVEDGARRDRERIKERGGDKFAVRPGESEEDAQKRIAKIERKERAKMDEARRLKVIHDTYEDRIKMLRLMSSEQSEPITEEFSTRSLEAPTTSDPSYSIVAPAMVSRRSQNRSISSLETVSIAPATFEPISLRSAQPSRSTSANSLLPGNDDEKDTTPRLQSQEFHTPSTERNHVDSVLNEQQPPDSSGYASASVSVLSQIGAPNHLGTPLDDSARLSVHSRSISNDSDASDDRIPVTARETPTGWPSQREEESARIQKPFLLPSPTPAAPISPNFTAQRTPRPLDFSGSNETPLSQLPYISNATIDARSIFADSHVPNKVPVISHSGPSDTLNRPAGVRTSSLMASARAGRAVTAALKSDLPVDRPDSTFLLVNDSTSTGTISQRRRNSQPSTALNENEMTRMRDPDLDDKREGASPLNDKEDDATVRKGMLSKKGTGLGVGSLAASSAANEFGQVDGAPYSSASLPSRFRTHSQLGQRPSLHSLEQKPPVPPLVPVGHRSISLSGPAPMMMRKGSVPASPDVVGFTPTPSLIRSNSQSSQGSHSERERLSRGTPSPSWNYMSTFASSREVLSAASMGRQNTAGYATPTSFDSPQEPLSPPGPLALRALSPDSNGAASSALRRPFYLMRQILQTIETDGGYITPTLYIPHQVWSQAGVKLVAVETKVRMLDLLLTGLEAVDKLGKVWWRAEGSRATRDAASRFNRELESFEGLTEGIQSTLSKKLGFASTGKKMGSHSFSAWSSKLSRSLDRVTNGRSLDHPATYVDSIARVLHQAQCLDAYLVTINDRGFPISEMDERDRAQLTVRLKRLSEFFGGMICRFILRDIGMLVDKYVKRAGVWFSENNN